MKAVQDAPAQAVARGADPSRAVVDDPAAHDGAPSFGCFETVLGHCGLAWRGDRLIASQLPETSVQATRQRLARSFPTAIDIGIFDPAAPEADRQPPIPDWVRIAAVRIQAALAGQPDDLTDLPLDLSGIAPFERRVYEVARAIPFGQTIHYGELARRIGEPGAARAVGRALGRNPFAPIVPCHRILAAGAGPGGFSATGGVTTKLRMLLAEGARFGDAPGLFDDLGADQFRTGPSRTGPSATGACAERVASTPARSISRSASAR